MKTGLLQFVAVVMGTVIACGLVSRTDAAVITYWDFGTAASPTLLAASADANVTTVGAATQGSPTTFGPTNASTTYVQQSGTAISGQVLAVNGPVTVGLTTKTSADLAANGNYWSVKVTAVSGATLSLDSLAFDYSLVSSSRGWALGYVADGGAVVAMDTRISAGSTDTDYKHTQYTLNLTGLTSIEFRWYTLSSNNNVRTLQFDNLTVNGTAVVPEPATVCLLLAGVGMMGLSRRR